MLTLQKIQTDNENYPFAENLLHESFPPEERRDDEAQRHNTDHNPKFSCYLITDNAERENALVGIITVWNLQRFYYLEHLATSPDVRNKGYGKQIMQQIQDMLPGIIILEVERPENEIATRRINFYQRCGFSLCEKNYIQPPYRKGGEEVPLYLMYKGTTDIDELFPEIRKTIYHDVYGTNV